MASAARSARFSRARALGAVAALLFSLTASPVGTGTVAGATSATVPPGFRDELLWGGLSYPTAVAVTPDANRVFVAQKDGRIKVFDGLADPTATTIADLRPQVYDYWDRGLLGMAVDPGYPTRPYLYVLYAYDSVPWNDSCPTPPGSTTDGCLAMGRLSRLTVSGAGLGDSITNETVLLTDWCQQYPSHSVGTVAFGPDGALYVSGGEGASFTAVRDSGQYGGIYPGSPTPVNPCGDPPSQGGALRSQDIRTTADPTGLSGTVIRVDPDTGAAWPANANVGAADANARRIIGYGLRNPFRFAFDHTGGLWIGDVGYGVWEEIDEIPDPDATARNFGWPCYEGTGQQAAYYATVTTPPTYDPALCTSLSGPTGPVHAYAHGSEGVSGDGCGTGSSAIAGITFLGDDSGYPDTYDGGLFWTDYNRKCIWFAPRGANGRPDFAARTRFADLRRSDDGGTNGASVFLGTLPNGELLYTNFDRGEVRKIRFYPPNAPPSAAFSATPTSGVAPLHVDLDASATTDSNHDTLTYAWDLDGDGQYDDATGVTTSTTFSEPGDVVVGLRVTDDGLPVLSDTASATISVGNAPPVITMTKPGASLTWAVGDAIAFAATATDAQDGTVPASAFHWTWAIAHCDQPDECHEHIVQTFDGVRSGTFPAPDHPYPSHLHLTLTVADSDGLETTMTRDLDPKTGVVTATSSPPGIPLTYDNESEQEPVPATGIVGSTVTLEAPASATLGETTYAFDHWSDGHQARSHAVPVVTGTTSLTAVYRLLRTTDAPDTCAATTVDRRLPTWRGGRLPNASDVDWYRFTMPASGVVRIVLGDLSSGASLVLYQGCSTVVATQDRSGTSSEEIVKGLARGTYAVKVTSTGAGSMNPYALQIRRLPAGVSLQSATSRTSGGTLILSGEVWNASGVTQSPVTVVARLLDSQGALLDTWTGATLVPAVGSGRAPFRISGTLPAGFASVRYTITSTAAGTAPVTLGASGMTAGTSSGRWRVQGSISGPSAVHDATVVLVQYDAHGDVIDVTPAVLGQTSLTAGSPTTFDAWSSMTGGAPDRYRIIALATAD